VAVGCDASGGDGRYLECCGAGASGRRPRGCRCDGSRAVDHTLRRRNAGPRGAASPAAGLGGRLGPRRVLEGCGIRNPSGRLACGFDRRLVDRGSRRGDGFRSDGEDGRVGRGLCGATPDDSRPWGHGIRRPASRLRTGPRKIRGSRLGRSGGTTRAPRQGRLGHGRVRRQSSSGLSDRVAGGNGRTKEEVSTSAVRAAKVTNG
jgi:hypothetical protein